MTSQELGVMRDVLVSQKVIAASASDGDVAAAHAAMLSGPNADAYKAELAARGVNVGMSWTTIIGLVGGAVALYYLWQHYQKSEINRIERPEPVEVRHQLRGMSRALGALGGPKQNCRPARRMGRLPPGTDSSRDKYEFEPEIRLEGYRSRKSRRK